MTEANRSRSRLQLLLVGLVFGGPLVVATVMYYAGLWQPAGSTNHGALLDPIVNLAEELP